MSLPSKDDTTPHSRGEVEGPQPAAPGFFIVLARPSEQNLRREGALWESWHPPEIPCRPQGCRRATQGCNNCTHRDRRRVKLCKVRGKTVEHLKQTHESCAHKANRNANRETVCKGTETCVDEDGCQKEKREEPIKVRRKRERDR